MMYNNSEMEKIIGYNHEEEVHGIVGVDIRSSDKSGGLERAFLREYHMSLYLKSM